jgi:predicted DNA-binding transcriptional regulator AlpA
MNPLIDIDGLARLLNRNAATIRRDLRRNPDAVPPRLQLPGTRLLRWREADIAAWLNALGSSQAGRSEGQR